jgi:hypothetical protein
MPIGDDIPVIPEPKVREKSLKKNLKKSEKKLASLWRLPLNGGFDATSRP